MITSIRTRGLVLSAMALLIAAGPGALAVAQPYDQGGPQSGHDQQRRDYDAQYGPGAYDRYQQARAEDDRQNAQAHDDAQRRDYDAQYGLGAYERSQVDDQARANEDRRYAQSAQTYDGQRRAYDAQYGAGAYDRYQADQQARADAQACHDQRKGNELAGGVLGGIAGAVIGSNVTRGGGREGGTIIGAGAGALAGSQIAKGQTNCN